MSTSFIHLGSCLDSKLKLAASHTWFNAEYLTSKNLYCRIGEYFTYINLFYQYHTGNTLCLQIYAVTLERVCLFIATKSNACNHILILVIRFKYLYNTTSAVPKSFYLYIKMMKFGNNVLFAMCSHLNDKVNEKKKGFYLQSIPI